MVTDTNKTSDIPPLSELVEAEDGYNVAFLYNMSRGENDFAPCQV